MQILLSKYFMMDNKKTTHTFYHGDVPEGWESLRHSRFLLFLLSFPKGIYNIMLAIAHSSASCADALAGMTTKIAFDFKSGEFDTLYLYLPFRGLRGIIANTQNLLPLRINIPSTSSI